MTVIITLNKGDDHSFQLVLVRTNILDLLVSKFFLQVINRYHRTPMVLPSLPGSMFASR